MNARQRRKAIRAAYPGEPIAEARMQWDLDRIHARGGCVCACWDCPICGCVATRDPDDDDLDEVLDDALFLRQGRARTVVLAVAARVAESAAIAIAAVAARRAPVEIVVRAAPGRGAGLDFRCALRGANSMWVGVHASKGWYGDQFTRGQRSPLQVQQGRERYDAWARRLNDMFPGWSPASFCAPRGALLGVMHVVDVFVFESKRVGRDWCTAAEQAEEALGPQAFGPVCYVLDDARALPEPIPCKGALGLWTVPDEHVPTLKALVPR